MKQEQLSLKIILRFLFAIAGPIIEADVRGAVTAARQEPSRPHDGLPIAHAKATAKSNGREAKRKVTKNSFFGSLSTVGGKGRINLNSVQQIDSAPLALTESQMCVFAHSTSII